MDTEAETGGAGWAMPLRGSGTGAMTTGAAGAGSTDSFGSSAVTGAALVASSTILDPVFFLRDRLEAALLGG